MIIKDSSKYYRVDGKSGRYYCRQVDNEEIRYPSVTTVISQNNGKKKSGGTSPSAVIGTITHRHILKRYSSKLLPLNLESIWNLSRTEVIGRVRRNLNMWDQLNLSIKPICVETGLFNNNPRIAGTLDLLCRLNGELTLVDIKTGMYYDSHPLQAACYWHMLKRKPKVCFIYLDSIIDRNPEQQATIKYFTEKELKDGYDTFLERYMDFRWE